MEEMKKELLEDKEMLDMCKRTCSVCWGVGSFAREENSEVYNDVCWNCDGNGYEIDENKLEEQLIDNGFYD